MTILLKWLISASAILISAYLLPGITVVSFWTALWLALFLAIVNTVIRPILVLLTLPINILTLGLFIFIINGALVLLAASVIKGFLVNGFLTAMLFSVVLSIIGYILNKIFITK